MAEQLRLLLVEAHAVMAKLRRLAPVDGHAVDHEPEPHPAQPPTEPYMKHG